MPYRLSYSQAIREKLKQLAVEAKELGLANAFQSAAKTILARLQSDPLEFGEPQYSHAEAKLLVRVAIVQPLVVYFGVHVPEEIVFIKDFLLLTGRES
jgi:hypothetical protein